MNNNIVAMQLGMRKTSGEDLRKQYKDFNQNTSKLRMGVGIASIPSFYARTGGPQLLSQHLDKVLLGRGTLKASELAKTKNISQQEAFNSVMRPLTETVTSMIGGIMAIGNTFSSMAFRQRAMIDKAYSKELGGAGKVTKGLDLFSATSRLWTLPMIAMALMGKSSGYKGLTTTLSGLLGVGVGKASLGLAGASILANIIKSKKLAAISINQQTGSVAVRRHSKSRFLNSAIARATSAGQLSSGEQIQIQLMGLIEGHTSVLPEIWSFMDLNQQQKTKGAKYTSGTIGDFITDDGKSKGGLIDGILNRLLYTTTSFSYKYNPIEQLFTWIFQRKKPKEVMEELRGVFGIQQKELKAKEASARKKIGVSISTYRLMNLEPKNIIAMGSDPVVSLLSWIGMLNRSMLIETVTMRKTGMGISQTFDMDDGFNKTVRQKVGGFLKRRVLDPILNIPGINALYNVTSGIAKAPWKMGKALSNSILNFPSLLSGGVVDYIKDPRKLLEKAGIKKEDSERSVQFMAYGLPEVQEAIRSLIEEQLQVQQDTYVLLADFVSMASGGKYHAQPTTKIPSLRSWSSSAGRYLYFSPEEAQQERSKNYHRSTGPSEVSAMNKDEKERVLTVLEKEISKSLFGKLKVTKDFFGSIFSKKLRNEFTSLEYEKSVVDSALKFSSNFQRYFVGDEAFIDDVDELVSSAQRRQSRPKALSLTGSRGVELEKRRRSRLFSYKLKKYYPAVGEALIGSMLGALVSGPLGVLWGMPSIIRQKSNIGLEEDVLMDKVLEEALVGRPWSQYEMFNKPGKKHTMMQNILEYFGLSGPELKTDRDIRKKHLPTLYNSLQLEDKRERVLSPLNVGFGNIGKLINRTNQVLETFLDMFAKIVGPSSSDPRFIRTMLPILNVISTGEKSYKIYPEPDDFTHKGNESLKWKYLKADNYPEKYFARSGMIVPPKPGGTQVTVGEGGESEIIAPMSRFERFTQAMKNIFTKKEKKEIKGTTRTINQELNEIAVLREKQEEKTWRGRMLEVLGNIWKATTAKAAVLKAPKTWLEEMMDKYLPSVFKALGSLLAGGYLYDWLKNLLNSNTGFKDAISDAFSKFGNFLRGMVDVSIAQGISSLSGLIKDSAIFKLFKGKGIGAASDIAKGSEVASGAAKSGILSKITGWFKGGSKGASVATEGSETALAIDNIVGELAKTFEWFNPAGLEGVGVATEEVGTAAEIVKGGGILSKFGKLLGYGGKVLSSAFSVVGGVINFLGKITKYVPILKKLPIIGYILSAFDAISALMSTNKIFGLKEGESANTGQQISAAIGGVISGLSFGYLSVEGVAKGIYDFGSKLVNVYDNYIKPAGPWIVDKFTSIYSSVKDLGSFLLDSIFKPLIEVGKTGFNKVSEGASALFSFLTDNVFTPLVGFFGEKWKEFKPWFDETSGELFKVGQDVFKLGKDIFDFFSPVLKSIFDELSPVVKQLAGETTELVKTLGGALATVLGWAVKNVVPYIGQVLTVAGKSIGSLISFGISAMSGTVKLLTIIFDGFKKVWNYGKSVFGLGSESSSEGSLQTSAAEMNTPKIPDFPESPSNQYDVPGGFKVGEFNFDAPKIPTSFATGDPGIVQVEPQGFFGSIKDYFIGLSNKFQQPKICDGGVCGVRGDPGVVQLYDPNTMGGFDLRNVPSDIGEFGKGKYTPTSSKYKPVQSQSDKYLNVDKTPVFYSNKDPNKVITPNYNYSPITSQPADSSTSATLNYTPIEELQKNQQVTSSGTDQSGPMSIEDTLANFVSKSISGIIDAVKGVSNFTSNTYNNVTGFGKNLAYNISGGRIGNSSINAKQKRAMDFFKSKGFSDVQAAAIVGNLMWESGLNENEHTGDGGKAFGIAQWHPDRKANLVKFANGKPINDLDLQLAFVEHELRTSYGKAYNIIKSASDIDTASRAFSHIYEGAGIPHDDKREKLARDILSAYQSGALNASIGNIFGANTSSAGQGFRQTLAGLMSGSLKAPNCGGAAAMLVNSELQARGKGRMLPTDGLGPGEVTGAARRLGVPILQGKNQVTLQNLMALGEGTIIRYTRAPGHYYYGHDDNTHAETIAINPSTNQLGVYSYTAGRRGYFKALDNSYMSKEIGNVSQIEAANLLYTKSGGPNSSGKIISSFGRGNYLPIDPSKGMITSIPGDSVATRSGIHTGVDIASPEGTPIHSVGIGKVIQTYDNINNSRTGWGVAIQHPDGIVSRYFHMNSPANVQEGSYVDAGQNIGNVGSTGGYNGMGSHLHFETLPSDQTGGTNYYNPLQVYPGISKSYDSGPGSIGDPYRIEDINKELATYFTQPSEKMVSQTGFSSGRSQFIKDLKSAIEELKDVDVNDVVEPYDINARKALNELGLQTASVADSLPNILRTQNNSISTEEQNSIMVDSNIENLINKMLNNSAVAFVEYSKKFPSEINFQ